MNKNKLPRSHALPRPFSFHFGKGMITEEVRVTSPYHEPTIQLLEFEQGPRSIRFCAYRHGMFQRMPLLVGEEDIAELGAELKKAPKLRSLLKNLTEGDRS
jgi:hypothetical protein